MQQFKHPRKHATAQNVTTATSRVSIAHLHLVSTGRDRPAAFVEAQLIGKHNACGLSRQVHFAPRLRVYVRVRATVGLLVSSVGQAHGTIGSVGRLDALVGWFCRSVMSV